MFAWEMKHCSDSPSEIDLEILGWGKIRQLNLQTVWWGSRMSTGLWQVFKKKTTVSCRGSEDS